MNFNSAYDIFNCCLKLIANDINYYKGVPDNSPSLPPSFPQAFNTNVSGIDLVWDLKADSFPRILRPTCLLLASLS